jgi:hypothetical protein
VGNSLKRWSFIWGFRLIDASRATSFASIISRSLVIRRNFWASFDVYILVPELLTSCLRSLATAIALFVWNSPICTFSAGSAVAQICISAEYRYHGVVQETREAGDWGGRTSERADFARKYTEYVAICKSSTVDIHIWESCQDRREYRCRGTQTRFKLRIFYNLLLSWTL